MNYETSSEYPLPPVHPDDIKEKVDSDVVVLGGGISGLTAAPSAAEAGGKVTLLEKSPNINFRGVHNAAMASRLQKEAGMAGPGGIPYLSQNLQI